MAWSGSLRVARRYEYLAELQLRPADEDGWAFGCLASHESKRGIFPGSFVEVYRRKAPGSAASRRRAAPVAASIGGSPPHSFPVPSSDAEPGTEPASHAYHTPAASLSTN